MTIPDTDPIVVAPTPTPFDSGDQVDHDALARNVERWLTTPLSGFVLGTANGEELALSDAEKIGIVETVSQAHDGERFVIASIDNPSSTETLRLAESYAVAGADMGRVRISREVAPSAGGSPAVCRLDNGEGVTCGIWLEQDDERITLGRLSDGGEETVRAAEVLWSLEVLYTVRSAA